MARKLAEVTTAPSTDDLSEQVATLRKDVGALTELLGEFGKAQGEQLTKAAKQKIDTISAESKARASAAADTASAQFSQAQAQANDFVKTQPATALGIAAGFGFLVGFMSGRK